MIKNLLPEKSENIDLQIFAGVLGIQNNTEGQGTRYFTLFTFVNGSSWATGIVNKNTTVRQHAL